jgi:hypothetical protein
MTRAAYAQTAHRYTARTHRLLVLRDQVVAPMLADVLAHDLGDPPKTRTDRDHEQLGEGMCRLAISAAASTTP